MSDFFFAGRKSIGRHSGAAQVQSETAVQAFIDGTNSRINGQIVDLQRVSSVSDII